MATSEKASARITAATNCGDFNTLNTTSDRYPIAPASRTIMLARSLTFAEGLQATRKNLHESALKKFAVHFSSASRGGDGRPHPIAVPTPDPPPGTLATSSSFSRKISTEFVGILGLLRSP